MTPDPDHAYGPHQNESAEGCFRAIYVVLAAIVLGIALAFLAVLLGAW